MTHFAVSLNTNLTWYFEISRTRYSQMFLKVRVLKNFAIFTVKHLCWNPFLKKETPTQVFSCEYCEIFKNSLFYRTQCVYPNGNSFLYSEIRSFTVVPKRPFIFFTAKYKILKFYPNSHSFFD